MLRFFIGLLLLSSCSLGVIKKGGDKAYVYDSEKTYTIDELKSLAPQVVTTSQRDPENGKLEELFSADQAPLKRIGILVFETMIQPTVAGLAENDLVYLSAQGKQILTENLLSIWEQSFPILGEKVDFVETSEISESKAFKKYGFEVKDLILSKRDTLAPDDIFFLPKGRTTAPQSVLNPRGMRNLSLALVPATELMAGPKFSEHAKHAVNDVAKELNLDAVIIVMSKLNWSVAHTDKDGESHPEQAVVQLESSILVPLSSYHARLKKTGEKRNLPNTTIAYRAYEAKVKVPVELEKTSEDQNFETIEKNLLTPVLNTYNDLTHMLQAQMIRDINKTLK